MTWIRRQQCTVAHACPTPARKVRIGLPAPPPPSSGAAPGWKPGPPTYHDMTVTDGSVGDLWRCDDCGKLWRFADRLDLSNGRGYVRQPGWEPASVWQRIRHRQHPQSRLTKESTR